MRLREPDHDRPAAGLQSAAVQSFNDILTYLDQLPQPERHATLLAMRYALADEQERAGWPDLSLAQARRIVVSLFTSAIALIRLGDPV